MIPAEAVEAAAKAMAWAHHPSYHTADECWQDVSDAAREDWKLDARAALKAALPHLPQLSRRQGSKAVGNLIKTAKANGWDEGKRAADLEWQQSYDLVTPDEDRFVAANPYRSKA